MYRKLYRSRRNKMIGGVAGGLADYFEIDPTLVRIIFIITLFLGGSGVLAYIILWIVVPEEHFRNTGTSENPTEETSAESENKQKQESEAFEEHSRKRSETAGIIIIAIGILFLLNNFVPHFHLGDYWPLILIAIGAGILLNSKKD